MKPILMLILAVSLVAGEGKLEVWVLETFLPARAAR